MADTTPSNQKYMEDFRSGDHIKTEGFTVSADLMKEFAKVYDPQPMHLDEAAAKESVFGELIGSGWQTLAITMRLLVDATLLGGGAIVGAEFGDLRFHRPTKPGDTLLVGAEVLGTLRCPPNFVFQGSMVIIET
jgi:acyl dehydratase